MGIISTKWFNFIAVIHRLVLSPYIVLGPLLQYLHFIALHIQAFLKSMLSSPAQSFLHKVSFPIHVVHLFEP